MTHKIELNIKFCNSVHKGRKMFEIIRQDRNNQYQVGDYILFTPVDEAGAFHHPVADEKICNNVHFRRLGTRTRFCSPRNKKYLRDEN